MKKFIALSASRLRLDDLAGLVSETIEVATPQSAALGAVGVAKLQALTASNNTFLSLMSKNRSSLLTPLIVEHDKHRDTLFAEIRRIAKAGQKSSVPATAAAGAKLMIMLQPFWHVSRSPLLSQTKQIDIFAERYAADAEAVAAATTLGLTSILQTLFSVNASLSDLYNERLTAMAAAASPSASSVKNEVIAGYDEFCIAIEITLSALPTDDLQCVFSEMNDLRRKYIFRLPIPLTEAHTSVAPIPEQAYTGSPITPIPRVFYQTDAEMRELIFAHDFDVTYLYNIKVGEAKLIIHGKGKYTGSYTSTFHIVNMNDEQLNNNIS
jgi:hypothetical protein